MELHVKGIAAIINFELALCSAIHAHRSIFCSGDDGQTKNQKHADHNACRNIELS